MRDRLRILPALILVVVAVGASITRTPRAVELRAPLRSLPGVVGLPARDVEIDEGERRVAGMSDYILREVDTDSLPRLSLYVAYYSYQVQGKTIHSPKNCLPGAGWTALTAGTEQIAVHDSAYEVNRYLFANGPSRALVYYWYQGRGRIAANEYRVKWNLLRDAMLDGRTDEALVRIVIPVSGGDEGLARSDSLARLVAGAVIPELWRVLPTSDHRGMEVAWGLAP